MNPVLALDHPAIEPGDPITGTVTWKGDIASVLVTLRWETRGKGDLDRRVVATTTLPAAGLVAVRFALTAPHEPFSFSGKLISVVYVVTASVANLEITQEVVIAPGGKEVVLASAG
jgi:hypothetical protein